MKLSTEMGPGVFNQGFLVKINFAPIQIMPDGLFGCFELLISWFLWSGFTRLLLWHRMICKQQKTHWVSSYQHFVPAKITSMKENQRIKEL